VLDRRDSKFPFKFELLASLLPRDNNSKLSIFDDSCWARTRDLMMKKSITRIILLITLDSNSSYNTMILVGNMAIISISWSVPCLKADVAAAHEQAADKA
jgi:hypothetical protein